MIKKITSKLKAVKEIAKKKISHTKPIILTPLGVQNEIKKSRHKAEVPIYLIVSVLGAISMFHAIITFFVKPDMEASVKEVLEGMETSISAEETNQIIEVIKQIPKNFLVFVGFLTGILALILLVAGLFMALYYIYAGNLAFAVKVSEKNFPQIYKKVKEYTYLLGLKKEPDVFVAQENGALNAFTSWIPGRAYIHLNAEMVDIAYMENKDFETVYFVMAHEFGHIYLHHVQIYYTIWSTLASFIPIIGFSIIIPLLSRAREYSADRVAQALTNSKNQEDCMMLLGVGRHLYRHVKIKEYMNDIFKPKGAMVRFMRWITNLMASHPIMPFRVNAVLDKDKKSGRLV